MTKKALITGIAGQDGSYLTEYLLSLGYEVQMITFIPITVIYSIILLLYELLTRLTRMRFII